MVTKFFLYFLQKGQFFGSDQSILVFFYLLATRTNLDLSKKKKKTGSEQGKSINYPIS